MNAIVQANVIRRLETIFQQLADDGVACTWTSMHAAMFEPVLRGPYSDDNAQEAIDRLAEWARSTKTVPQAHHLAGYLQSAVSRASGPITPTAATPPPPPPGFKRDPHFGLYEDDSGLSEQERKWKSRRRLLADQIDENGEPTTDFARQRLARWKKQDREESEANAA